MFKFLFTLTCRNEKRRQRKKKQAEIMETIRQATIDSRCVIIGETPLGTRIIVLGKPLWERQIEDILKAERE